MKWYISNLMSAFSRLSNALLGGYSGEMLCSRVYREKIFWAILMFDTIFFWDYNHCYNIFVYELENNDRPPEFRILNKYSDILLKDK
jgi:hypothetical protein